MPAGRPTKYVPAYCDDVIKFSKAGYSLTAYAGHIGVSRSTISEWMHNFPEFSAALKIAAAVRTKALEEQMLSASTGPAVTARIFALKNAAPEEFSEKHHVAMDVKLTIADLVMGSFGKEGEGTS